MTTTQEQSHPYVAVHVQATGIHPSTARLLTIYAITFNEEGDIGEEFHTIVNPASNPGPRHMHGLEPADFEQAQRFSRHLRTLDKLIDDRTLIVHDAPMVWGFLVSESRRAMNAAARANRSRNRSRGRRRQRVGHVPRPAAIVDTVASARRQANYLPDTRLNSVALALGLEAPSPVASVERARADERDLSRASAMLLFELYKTLEAKGEVVSLAPETLKPDRFGLQRSAFRVSAQKAEPQGANPGVYVADQGLKPGMEFVVTEDVESDPDELIRQGIDAGLTFSEKVTRTASLVVTNATHDLRGKAMHADRKDIPLVSDKDFLAALASMN
ncbi:exonuclease domain-containing protein [Corynebacterium breve]|uniref:Exonuclease domain-containing protein n=1 Tax=Corynebacterium breve TaxID=3049799 RepID=A0ABY8VK09_9CORY|nr:exonuclease domain-containing protein [Corynebacterium breve]WIM67910.1 exonuclease domain-containing protein [Corynebacterium breve]